jgi:hypothetical protein
MLNNDAQKQWEEYRTRELTTLAPLLAELGFELEPIQPHIGGERYLMHAVTTASGSKLVLLGRRKNNGERVVIKATSDAGGKREIGGERKARDVLNHINFAYRIFRSPKEILYATRGDYAISVQQFIEQEQSFLERPLEEQFALALKAFKAQEGAHMTTYGHRRLIAKTFETATATEYLDRFKRFRSSILSHPHESRLEPILDRATICLTENREIIEQYSGFLTHTDFVPHNFRIVGNDMYLLDHSSLRFGNKYEGWARFLNFMALYNPALEQALAEYVRLNRTPEEVLSLKAMRIYRLGEIIWFYTERLPRSSGDQHTLDEARVCFWTDVLAAVLDNALLSSTLIEEYRSLRDGLRSDEEKRRQQGLH